MLSVETDLGLQRMENSGSREQVSTQSPVSTDLDQVMGRAQAAVVENRGNGWRQTLDRGGDNGRSDWQAEVGAGDLGEQEMRNSGCRGWGAQWLCP